MTFDLEKARAADEVLPYPLDAKEIWVSGKGQMHINPPNAPSIFFTLSDLCEFRNIFHGQAAEIERLRADYDKLKSSLLVIDGCKKLMNQAARIDELEADNQNLVTLNRSLMNNDWILRDNNRKYRKRAQKAELLNKELKSKIGPDAKPRSWQITEERKAAILHCKRMLTFLKEDDAPCYDVEKITKDESVLVAMMKEAGQSTTLP